MSPTVATGWRLRAMSSLKEQIVKNSNRIEEICKIRLWPNMGDAYRWVKALKEGKILFSGKGGYIQEIEVGLKGIDWKGKHLDHPQWPLTLNAFSYLQPLAEVYKETGDEELAYIARSLIEDWIDSHEPYSPDRPPRYGRDGDSTLGISVRLGQGNRPGWWGTMATFAKSPHYDEEFIKKMVDSTKNQLDCLCANLRLKGNWRISHLDCILYCSLLIPGFEQYQAFAVKNLNEVFNRQIQADGSHEEHTPGYHEWMWSIFARLWYLSQAYPELGLNIDTEKTARMWDYYIYSITPDGSSAGIHNSHPWSKGPGRIKVIEEREEFLKAAGLSGDEWSLEKNPSKYFPCAGHIFIRDSWEPDATFLFFDATNWGGGHCHLSKMSISLYSGSRMLLCDPGSFDYDMSNVFGPYAKSTPAHNTITIGNMNQTEANPYTYKADIFNEAAVIASSYEGSYFPGTYGWNWPDGKGPGIFGIHTRVLLWLKKKYALVFDTIRSDNGQNFAAHWQFPAGAYKLDAKNGRCWTVGGEDNVLVHCIDPQDYKFVVYEGSKDPLLGWQADKDLQYKPAPMFSIEGIIRNQERELVTMLMPFRGDTLPDIHVEKYGTSDIARGLKITMESEEDIIVYSSNLLTHVGKVGSVESDGSMVVISFKKGEITRVILVDGTFVEYNGEKIVENKKFGTYIFNF